MEARSFPPEARRLEALGQYAVFGTGPETGFDDVAELAARVCGASLAYVAFVGKDRIGFKACHGFHATTISRQGAYGDFLLTQAGAHAVEDAGRDPRFRGDELLNGELLRTRFHAGVALREPGGSALGAICVLDQVPCHFDAGRRRALEALGRQAEALLELRRARLEIDRDIAERDHALAELEKERAAATMIFQRAPVAIWYKDTETRIVRMNEAAAQFMGRRFGEVEGRAGLELHSPEAAAAYQAADREVIRTGQPKLGIVETLESPNGEVRWIRTDKVPHRDEAGQIIGVIVIAQDITEVKAAEAARLEMERSLQQNRQRESLGVLAGGVAHEFNNVLTTICGKAGLAQAILPVASPARRHLEGIEAAVRRAGELCRQMLAYSGHDQYAFEPVRLRDFVESCLPEIRAGDARFQSLCLEPGNHNAVVRADAGQLRQIVHALAANAFEACEGMPHSAEVRVRLGETPDAEPPVAAAAEAFLEMVDNGCGMTGETLARIFEPFFTTKFTGRGLGLAVALGIARAHNGTMEAESAPGAGTTVRLRLPRGARL